MRPPGLLRRVVSGDRPYVVAFFVLLAVLATMVVGPLQSYTTAAERVHDLELTRAELHAQVLELQERRQRLKDPEEIELLARQRLGLVKPGEVPFVVSDGAPESDQVRPDGRPLTRDEPPSLLRRVGEAFARLFSR
ncbi:MAG TPA: septum formation initiator family protein [Egibacteraceae bacterium]|nr:septum formation initiator family protein [Egibacteraceae bacterium]